MVDGVIREGKEGNVVRFFFQAEDGIRDTSVTGVQTCALPIFGRGRPPPFETRCIYSPYLFPLASELNRSRCCCRSRRGGCGRQVKGIDLVIGAEVNLATRGRSEERRVGKECRSGWWSSRVCEE